MLSIHGFVFEEGMQLVDTQSAKEDACSIVCEPRLLGR